MARPIKEGLQYFPLDVDIDQDDKISMIEAIHGIKGFGVVVKLLMKIYKEGYFYKWSEREQLLFSKRVNVDINTTKSVVSDCLSEGLFDKATHDSHEILTSSGIQKRYLDAITRRKEVSLEKRYLLINPHEYIGENAKIKIIVLDENGNEPALNDINVDINHDSLVVKANISTQRRVEKSIEDKIKVKKKEAKEPNELDIYFESLWKSYPNKRGSKPNALKSFKKAIKEGTTLEEIQKGLSEYIAYCDSSDWYNPANASTWFNQNRWDNDYSIKDKSFNKPIEQQKTVEKPKNKPLTQEEFLRSE